MQLETKSSEKKPNTSIENLLSFDSFYFPFCFQNHFDFVRNLDRLDDKIGGHQLI